MVGDIGAAVLEEYAALVRESTRSRAPLVFPLLRLYAPTSLLVVWRSVSENEEYS